MFGFDVVDQQPLISGTLAPVRSDIRPPEGGFVVTVEEAKQHLGIPVKEPTGPDASELSATPILMQLIGWATQRVETYKGEALVVSAMTDYYTRLARRMRLSQPPDIDEKLPLADQVALQYLPGLGRDWTAVNGVALDETADPPVLIVPLTDVTVTLSDQHESPVRAVYRIHPFRHTGMDLVKGTILALVQFRWQTRGEPVSTATESAVRRILGANL